MNRSPLFYPLSRGMDADAGGIADLQTDVMRFMAILSLCLVAIFALVQSIPLAPSAEEPAPVVQAAKRQIVATPVEQATPHPEPIATVAEAIVAKPPAPDPPQEGFTLRFDNDVALTRLVARNEVGLYAIYPDRSFRLNVNRGQMSFWPASIPDQFHEMDVATVPKQIIDALQRSNGLRAQGLQWGVTIPAATARQLDQYLHETTGGTLIIDADGELRLER